MSQEILLQLLAEWGPWGIVGVLLFRCIKRQDAREDRLTEVVANSTAAIASIKSDIEKQR